MASPLVINVPETLEWQYRDEDGDAADPGTVTIGVVDAAGTVLVAAGTATSGSGTDARTYSLDAVTSLTTVTVTWTGDDVTHTQILPVRAAGLLFTEAAARVFDNNALANTTTYTDDAIDSERDNIAEDLERWTGRSWVPKYCRLETAGDGTRELWLDKGYARLSDGTQLNCPGRAADTIEVLSVTVGGSSVDTSNIVVLDGILLRTDSTWSKATTSDPLNVVVEFTYGVEAGTNGSDRIGMILLRDRLVASNISDRASSFSDELGTYRFVTAGFGSNVSSIPEVNAWVQSNDRRVQIA